MNIYIDMDGVVADFDGRAEQILGARPVDERWPEDQWQQLRNHKHLYRHLPKTPYADQVIAVARRFRDELGWHLGMLTAIPKGNDMPSAFYDKVLWMQDHYPDIPVYFGPYSKDKQLHCQPGDVLVDDRTSNIREWGAKGGTAIKLNHLRPQEAIDQMIQLLNAIR